MFENFVLLGQDGTLRQCKTRIPTFRGTILFSPSRTTTQKNGSNELRLCENLTRQAMYYNVTFRRVRLTIVALEMQQILHILNVCVCSLRYPGCKHKHHVVVCGLPRSTIFFHIISQTVRLSKKEKKKVIELKCVFRFSLRFCLQHFSF